MAIAGKLVSFTLVAALLALAAPAGAEPFPPSLPPVGVPPTPSLPPPPATLGRCLAVGQDLFNGGGQGFADARTAGLVALDHQRGASTQAFSVITSAAIPDAAIVNGTYAGLAKAGNASAGPLAALPVLIASSIGPALNLTMDGAGEAAATVLPAMAAQLNVSVPWVGDRGHDAIGPLDEWNRHNSTTSKLLNAGWQMSFFTGYAMGQVNGPAPPLGATYGAIGSASAGAGQGLAGAGLIGAGASQASDALVQGTLGLVGAGSPLAGGSTAIAGAVLAATQAGAGTIGGHAQTDSGTMAAALRAGATTAASRAQGAPSQLVACPKP